MRCLVAMMTKFLLSVGESASLKMTIVKWAEVYSAVIHRFPGCEPGGKTLENDEKVRRMANL